MIGTRIVVADDHPILLSGLVEELKKHKFNIVGTASDGLEALAIIRDKKPEIAILDIKMPLLDGFEVITKCLEINLSTKFILLTSYSEKGFVIKSNRLNLSGYLLKDEPFSEVLKCLQAVLNGEQYFSPIFSQITDLEINKEVKKLKFLSSSERTILRLVSQGKTSREIGDALSISPRTVKKHRENIASKLDISEQKISLSEWAIEYQEMLSEL